jgi:capsular exopolysaccharide synthesis family protein
VEAFETSAPEPTTFVDFMVYLRVLVRRRWLILLTIAVTVSAAGLYTLRQPKMYQATASLIIDSSAPRFLDNTQVPEVVDTGTGTWWYNKEHYETQYKVIVSRAVSKRVVEKLGLDTDLAFLGLNKVKDPNVLKAALARADATAVLQFKIKVQPVKESRLVYVVIEDEDPDRAALLANEVTQAYIAENLALKLRTTETASQWLEERLADYQVKTKQTELAVYQFKKDADMLTTSLEDRQSMVSQRLNSFNLALTEVKTKLAGLRAKVDAIHKLRDAARDDDGYWAEGLAVAEGNLLIHQLKLRYATQKDECAELQQRYFSGHPKLGACMDKLQSTKQDLIHELGNLVRAADTELSEALAKERNLADLLNETKAEAFEVNKKQIEFDRLKREAENNQRLYDVVLKREKDIELSGLLRTSNVRVLDPARPNNVPVRPNVKAALVIALMLGSVFGVGFAFALERINDTISSQAEVEEKLGLPFLGIMPLIPNEGDPALCDLHIHRQPKSYVAECCRAIRTNLLFMSPDKPFRTLLVCSSGPQEGKSTSTVGLGVALAQSGDRVLIVDTDMRRPRIHNVFRVPNDHGVSSVIVGEESLDSVIKSTEVPNLFVLPCGPIPPNPAELLHTKAFKELLSAVSSKFDRVILDSPPIGALTDAVVLSTEVDGVVMVLKAGKTPREAVKRAARLLGGVNAKLFGVILNKVDPSDPHSGGYFYAYRQHGYYYGRAEDKLAS